MSLNRSFAIVSPTFGRATSSADEVAAAAKKIARKISRHSMRMASQYPDYSFNF
jgi:hypothetical protein